MKVLSFPKRKMFWSKTSFDYAGMWFLNANSNRAPQIVDAACNPIRERSEFYSGCYGRASVTFFAFNSNGNRGIACGLGNLQKLRDGEPPGGGSTAAADFGGLEDEEDEDGRLTKWKTDYMTEGNESK